MGSGKACLCALPAQKAGLGSKARERCKEQWTEAKEWWKSTEPSNSAAALS